MPVESLFKGNKYIVSVWIDDEGNCPVKAYIEALYKENNPDAQAIINLLEKTANHGISQNEQKTRYLKGTSEGLIEFKARGGSRILGFIIDDVKLIICTHGIPKLKEKRFRREISKLEAIKESYECENLREDNDYVN